MTGWVSFTLLGMYADVGEVEDAIRTLSPAHTLVDDDDAGVMGVTDGRIKFDDVTFTYDGGAGGLNGINLSIESGEKAGHCWGVRGREIHARVRAFAALRYRRWCGFD